MRTKRAAAAVATPDEQAMKRARHAPPDTERSVRETPPPAQRVSLLDMSTEVLERILLWCPAPGGAIASCRRIASVAAMSGFWERWIVARGEADDDPLSALRTARDIVSLYRTRSVLLHYQPRISPHQIARSSILDALRQALRAAPRVDGVPYFGRDPDAALIALTAQQEHFGDEHVLVRGEGVVEATNAWDSLQSRGAVGLNELRRLCIINPDVLGNVPPIAIIDWDSSETPCVIELIEFIGDDRIPRDVRLMVATSLKLSAPAIAMIARASRNHALFVTDMVRKIPADVIESLQFEPTWSRAVFGAPPEVAYRLLRVARPVALPSGNSILEPPIMITEENAGVFATALREGAPGRATFENLREFLSGGGVVQCSAARLTGHLDPVQRLLVALLVDDFEEARAHAEHWDARSASPLLKAWTDVNARGDWRTRLAWARSVPGFTRNELHAMACRTGSLDEIERIPEDAALSLGIELFKYLPPRSWRHVQVIDARECLEGLMGDNAWFYDLNTLMRSAEDVLDATIVLSDMQCAHLLAWAARTIMFTPDTAIAMLNHPRMPDYAFPALWNNIARLPPHDYLTIVASETWRRRKFPSAHNHIHLYYASIAENGALVLELLRKGVRVKRTDGLDYNLACVWRKAAMLHELDPENGVPMLVAALGHGALVTYIEDTAPREVPAVLFAAVDPMQLSWPRIRLIIRHAGQSRIALHNFDIVYDSWRMPDMLDDATLWSWMVCCGKDLLPTLVQQVMHRSGMGVPDGFIDEFKYIAEHRPEVAAPLVIIADRMPNVRAYSLEKIARKDPEVLQTILDECPRLRRELPHCVLNDVVANVRLVCRYAASVIFARPPNAHELLLRLPLRMIGRANACALVALAKRMGVTPTRALARAAASDAVPSGRAFH